MKNPEQSPNSGMAESFEEPTLFRMYKDGTTEYRNIYIPSDATREAHSRFLGMLRHIDIPMPHSYGAVPGKGLLDNVAPHKDNTSFYMTDLKDAFPSVHRDQLRTNVSHMLASQLHPVYMAPVGDFLRQHAFVDGLPGLPLGYPASPALFNWWCYPMDYELGVYCKENKITYTRWLDDLTFSAPHHSYLTKRARGELRGIIEKREGFTVNHAKSRGVADTRKDGPAYITGLALYSDGCIIPSAKLLEKTRLVFDDIEQRLQTGDVGEEDLWLLAGYKGVLNLTGKPERSGRRVLPRLSRRQKKLVAGVMSCIGTTAPETPTHSPLQPAAKR